MADRAETLPDGCEVHGIPAYRDAAGTVHIATGARCAGPGEPGTAAYTELARLRSAADPERDSRREAYRERERRRAARALDRYLEAMFVSLPSSYGPEARVAGDRFVEAVGDYVLSRLAESSDRDVAYGLQQKSHYGASECGPACARLAPGTEHTHGEHEGVFVAQDEHPCAGGRCPDPEAHAEGAHDL